MTFPRLTNIFDLPVCKHLPKRKTKSLIGARVLPKNNFVHSLAERIMQLERTVKNFFYCFTFPLELDLLLVNFLATIFKHFHSY